MDGPHFVVVVYPETHLYRRACRIHTDPITDHFIEIGCAQGQTCYRIHNHTHHSDHLEEDHIRNNHSHHDHPQRRIVLGIDKSMSCIKDAHEQYGHVTTTTNPLQFVTYDVFQPSTAAATLQNSDVINTNEDNDGVTEIIQSLIDGYHQSITTTNDSPPTTKATIWDTDAVNNITRDMDHGVTSTTSTSTTAAMGLVIAIDINGNRDLIPIVQCLRIIMKARFSSLLPHGPLPPHPRLIIVKSRSLYLYLQQQQQPN
jgi:hypothetical protein